MIARLENAKLVRALDFDGFDLRNAGQFLPVPDSLLDTDDPRLSDTRLVPDGSVSDEHVAATAAIEQDKLLLDDDIPLAWLGNESNQAAQGDLVELSAQKGTTYAGLDSNGLIQIGDMPSTGPEAGTVNSVGFWLPKEFDVTVAVVTESGDLTATWRDQPDQSWFGVYGPIGLSALADTPSFLTKQIPIGLVPDLKGSAFGSGTFEVDRLPVMTPMGVGHERGIVPDPGATKEDAGDPSDYLGRDGTWRRVDVIDTKSPTLPDVQITLLGYFNGLATIRLYCPTKNSLVFYLIQDIGLSPILLPYEETANPTILQVNPLFTVLAYAAKSGYNNSRITHFNVPNPPNL